MKALLTIMASLSFIFTVFGQQDSGFTNKIRANSISKNDLPMENSLGLIPKLNPLVLLGIFQNTVNFNVSLEKEILQHESVQLTYEYIYSKNITIPNTSNRTNGYYSLLIPEFRYYFKTHNHSSFFISADFGYIPGESTYNDIPSYQTKFSTGINFGGKFIYKRIVLEFLFGLNTSLSSLTIFTYPQDNLFFRDGFGIGYRF